MNCEKLKMNIGRSYAAQQTGIVGNRSRRKSLLKGINIQQDGELKPFAEFARNSAVAKINVPGSHSLCSH